MEGFLLALPPQAGSSLLSFCLYIESQDSNRCIARLSRNVATKYGGLPPAEINISVTAH